MRKSDQCRHYAAIMQLLTIYVRWSPGGLPYITDGDARRNFQKKPLKVTILGVVPANFIP